MPPQLIDRREFISRFWTYEPGEHVTFLGPTGTGKTTLAMDLLLNGRNGRAVILDSKPRNRELDAWGKRHKVGVTPTWPLPTYKRLWFGPNKTWIVRPPHSMDDPDVDDARIKAVGGRAIMKTYRQGDTITYIDECLDVIDVGLSKHVRVVLTRGRSSGNGLWTGTQRPYHVPVYLYSSASHLFLANDPDERDQKRFAEIGGIDPKYVIEVVKSLPPYHWLYIKRKGTETAIIGP